ncbi:MAG: AMP-binding protein [Acidimicrobiales bacterium]|nr:AMP-binding protein [Acidimicrobiales bacterium]
MTRGTAVVTAAESERDQHHTAAALAASGLAPGDRVALAADGSPAYVAVALGALRTGIIPVLINTHLLPAEQDALLADARPSLVLRDGELDALVADGASHPEVAMAPAPLGRPMIYTSGTTGQPKGVWSGVLDDQDAAALLAEERDQWGFRADDVHLVASPLHHSAPLRFAAGTLLAGGTVVLPGHFTAEGFRAAVTAHRPTSAFLVPAHLQRLFAPDAPPLPDLSSFRLVAHAGAPCPTRLKERALEAFPEGSLWEFYGSTEAQFTVCSSDDWRSHPGTVGRARAGRRLSVDDDGTIWCDSPRHARFVYWNDPAKTAAAWRGDACTVGDLGRLDDEGYLYLEGRRSDLVITGGVNVYPLEVERALLEHPQVHEAAVFGVPDERWGQRVCAAVVGELSPAEVDAWLGERVAPFKRPKTVVVVDALPRNSMGKVRRNRLGAELGLE